MRSTVEERVSSAYQIYDEKLKLKLEPAFTGKIVAIHVPSGDYFLGTSPRDACQEGRLKHPGAVFVCRRIGSDHFYRVGAF